MFKIIILSTILIVVLLVAILVAYVHFSIKKAFKEPLNFKIIDISNQLFYRKEAIESMQQI